MYNGISLKSFVGKAGLILSVKTGMTRLTVPGAASAGNAAVFAAFFSYALFFLVVHGHMLNYECIYGGMKAFTVRREPWIIVSYCASILFILWVSYNYFFVKSGQVNRLSHIFLAAVCLRLVPAMITFGATADMATFEFVQRSAMAGRWPDYMQHAPYFPFYSYVLHLLGSMDRFLKLPDYFVIKSVPVLFDSMIVFPVYALTRNMEYAQKYAWNPVTIMICAVHGQFDSVTMFFILLSVYFMAGQKRTIAAGLSFGTAFQSKWWPVMLSPAYFLRLKKKDMLAFAASWLAVFLLFSWPYLCIDPGLLLKPLYHMGVPSYYGLTGLIYYIMVHAMHLNATAFNPALYACRSACLIAVAWALYASRKWELAASLFFTVLTFYIFCPGWSVQYYAWPAAFMFLFGLYKSRLYSAFAAIVFLIYFLVDVFEFGRMARASGSDIRNALTFLSVLIIAAAVPMWYSVYWSHHAQARGTS